MAQEKDKPTVETVQQAVKVSDLLMFEVCEPLKEKLNRIELCSPHIAICKPNVSCIPTKVCTPLVHCIPYDRCIPEYTCVPEKWCKPIIFGCKPEIIPPICQPDLPEICTPSAGPPWGPDPGIIKQRLLESDYVKLQAEVKTLKAEVDALKKRLK